MAHILLIDDDAQVRALLRAILMNEGFRVTEADGGTEGVRAFRQSRSDLVLCDLFMPDLDGLETIRQLRCAAPGVKVIAMSGNGFGGVGGLLPVAERFGAVGVLSKPFDRDTALTEVERALGCAG